MSLEDSVRAVVREEMKRVLREELRATIDALRAGTNAKNEFLSVKEAAELTRVSETTVREWMANGLRHYKQNRVVRLRRSELLAFLSMDSLQAQAEVDVEQRAVAILAKARGG